MPWQFEPKKDACLSAKTTMSPLIDVINRWFLNGVTPTDESQWILGRSQILLKKGTRGTETSQYPKENKTIVIALVAASERATV